jgi:hypothetical protein
MISFERRGWVSIWIGLTSDNQDKDVLKDLCGVDYYDVDYQENIISPNWEMSAIGDLVSKLSYSDSFLDQALEVAQMKGISEARHVIMQLNYKYDPRKVTKEVKSDPIFLGAFRWSK